MPTKRGSGRTYWETKREREYYRMGFIDAMTQSIKASGGTASGMFKERPSIMNGRLYDELGQAFPEERKPKRKLSAWQRYIKNKRNHITYRDGKLNLKAMGVQYRKKKRR